ncbi:MAG TPA: hypothetical protein V6C69_17010 [Trichormus sp.]|jgi:hypothetical protein
MMVEETKTQVRVGELLLQAGILTSEYIKNALQNFEQRGLPIGKVLVMSGYLTEHQLRTALEVQSLVNDGLLPLDAAVKVLQIAHKDKITLPEAFQQSGFVQPEDQQTNKLGQLLVSANIVNAKELEEGLQTNIRTGLPLGHIFCFRGAVSQSLIWTALLAQQMIRRGMVSREMAIQALIDAHEREEALEKLPINQGFQRLPMKPSLRLGELLVQARILSEGQLVDGLHNALIGRKFFGEVLVASKQASQDLIDAALDVQEMLDNGTITQILAGDALLLVRAKGLPLSRTIAEVGAFKARNNKAQRLMEILTSSGAVALNQLPREIQECLEVNYNQASQVSELLIEKELIPERLLYAALRAVYLIDEKILNLQQAIMAIDFAMRANLTLDQALIELGWTMRTRLRSA